ncbi:MAG: hypothetical protein ACKV2T_10720 [Kofleriaceae bacterium]
MSQASADQAMLAAGGLVPTSTKLGKADQVDTVVARAYRHAVLPGRAVIRLVAEGVVAGDELEMATLGFGAGEDRGAVAKERKRALGFPGWALVNDPKNARYALDVVKELKKVARRVKNKPGAAKEGFDKIAATLGKSVPHFLPSFFEEVGRMFLEHGAATFAATYFGKAREAEAVHALEVDEQHRVDAFLEFALAGAVTTKALSAYAKDLGEHHAPADAYAHFRKLCVQRTLGGMPPWAGMAKDLQRLAKAAKLDVAAEDRAVVSEIIASPALGRAAGEFWRAYREPIRDLGAKDPGVRAVILNLFPVGNTYSAELDMTWLDLVEETGGLASLVGAGDPAVQPTGGRATWFDKLTAHLARDWQDRRVPERAFALLRRMAPQLIADGAPIGCVGRYQTIDVDLCELALELGVPVAITVDPKRPWIRPKFGLDGWASWGDKPERGRDPVLAAKHPVLGPALANAVGDMIGKDTFDNASANKAGFHAAKRAWLEKQIDAAERSGLPSLVDTLAVIDKKVKASLFAELPDLHARFAAIDVGSALQKTLQIGIVDELGWPALEAVMKELSGDGTTVVAVHGGPPALVCCTKTKLVAVGGAGRLGEHDLVIPPKHEFHSARFIGGRFLVVLKEGSTPKGYWSNTPTELFTIPNTYVWPIVGLSQRAAVTPDGGWLESGKAIYAGDRVFWGPQELRAYDGVTAWVSDPNDPTKWRELSPAGERGRASWPKIVEDAIEAGWKVDASTTCVLPAITASSPIGTRDGLVGTIALHKMDDATPPRVTHRKLVAIGGPSWTAQTSNMYTGLLPLPGADEPRFLAEYSRYGDGTSTAIWDPQMQTCGSILAWKERGYSRAQAAPLVPIFWHLYSVRDERGSRRLRALTGADARALMAAIPFDEKGEIPSGVPDEPFAKALPEVSSQDVRNGITGVAIVAVKAIQERDRLARERAPGMATARRANAGIPDATINAALENLVDRVWNKDGSTWGQIATIGEWFAHEDRSNRYVYDAANVPQTELDWLDLAPARSVLALAALAIGTPVEHRKVLAKLFAHLARALPPADKLRVYGLDGGHGFPGGSHNGTDLRWHGGNAYAVRKRGYNELYRVLEYAPDGTFKAPPTGRIYDERRIAGVALGADALAELEAAIAGQRTSWSIDAAERIATGTGLSSSAATYLWAGMPNLHDRSTTFLDKELRETLGLKAAQAALGRDQIIGVRDYKRILALELSARSGVAAILDGTAADALVDAWVRLVGKRVPIPEALIAEADSALSATGHAAVWLAMFGAPDEAPQLAADGVFALDRSGDLIRASSPEPLVGQDKLVDPPPVFDGLALIAATQYLPFLYAELPVGDLLRAAAARAHEHILARLANPTLLLEAGVQYLDDAGAASMGRVLDGLAGQELTTLLENIRGVRVPGAIVIQTKSRATLKVSPATLDAKSQPLVDKLVAMMSTYGSGYYSALKYVRSPGLVQMMARIRDTPVPDGHWEQNPLLSTPTLVDKVAKKLGVSKDAAVLYLQYLVLLWPTPKAIAEYNGWKPKQLADANAQLLNGDLIVEAKRERAQRTYFLPGGWEALKSPHPPMESWKLALYGTRDSAGNPQPMNQRFLALAPFHVMFEAAWDRIENDDTPRYDEVKR